MHPWRSAVSHCGCWADPHLIPLDGLPPFGSQWRAWLCEPEEEDALRMLRTHARTGRPLGSERFVALVESLLNRVVRPRRGGRPRKQVKYGSVPMIQHSHMPDTVLFTGRPSGKLVLHYAIRSGICCVPRLAHPSVTPEYACCGLLHLNFNPLRPMSLPSADLGMHAPGIRIRQCDSPVNEPDRMTDRADP